MNVSHYLEQNLSHVKVKGVMVEYVYFLGIILNLVLT
jgi:hypothetical protein